MKASLTLFLLSLVSFLLLLNSCSVEKRRHLSGYHIDWKKKKNIAIQKNEVASVNNIPVQMREEASDYTASVSEQPEIINKKSLEYKKYHTPAIKFSVCDTIKKYDGTVIIALITGTPESVITYKDCNDENGTTHSVPKFLVHSLAYANGKKEFIHSDTIVEPREKKAKKRFNTKAVLSFILATLSFLMVYVGLALIVEGLLVMIVLPLAIIAAVFFIVSGILAISSIKEIIRERKNKGFGFSLTALILGVFISIYLLVLAIFIGVEINEY